MIPTAFMIPIIKQLISILKESRLKLDKLSASFSYSTAYKDKQQWDIDIKATDEETEDPQFLVEMHYSHEGIIVPRHYSNMVYGRDALNALERLLSELKVGVKLDEEE